MIVEHLCDFFATCLKSKMSFKWCMLLTKYYQTTIMLVGNSNNFFRQLFLYHKCILTTISELNDDMFKNNMFLMWKFEVSFIFKQK